METPSLRHCPFVDAGARHVVHDARDVPCAVTATESCGEPIRLDRPGIVLADQLH